MNNKIYSYLAVFSHELKSPLNSIINLEKLIKLKIEDSDETKLKSYISSAKFTKKGVILFLIREIKEGISISIKDTGCGIKEENLRKIFNPYFELEGNIYESSGLGLYITKHLLSILEGNISIKTEYNKGTNVEIFIPSKRK